MTEQPERRTDAGRSADPTPIDRTLSLGERPEWLEVPEHIAIPGYDVLEILGRGGMGVVYKGWQPRLQRFVALKLVLAGAHASPVEMARFRIEAESVGKLQHPHIVQIYEVGEHQGSPYCSLEFVEGGTLAQRLEGRPLEPRAAARLIEPLARAIESAHRRGIVHRDLKPANVLLTADGQPKITDFGLAKWINDDSAQTRTGTVVGTPAYMAPEQAAGKRDIGPAADIYALGAMLYELLTGQPPFRADSALDIVLMVLSEEPTAPRRVVRGVPRELETICLKCLEKDPQRRYASAGALADDLDRFLKGEPIAARPPGLIGRIDRWARLRPDLAVTYATLALFYLDHLVLMALGTPDEGGSFHWFVTALALVWAGGATGLQWLMTRTRWTEALLYVWGGFNVLMLTAFLLRAAGPDSPMIVGYYLLTAATALRFRIGMVWFVAGLSLVSYAGLIADAAARRPDKLVAPVSCFIFVITLTLTALVQHLLLRRLRAAAAAN